MIKKIAPLALMIACLLIGNMVFAQNNAKIGETLRIRLPNNYYA